MNNQLIGFASIKFCNGESYEGNISNGKFNGSGKYYYQDGQYDGEWKDGKREG